MRLPKVKDTETIDIEETKKMVDAFLEAGMNYFDTAYVYSGSEAALGEILERNGVRDQVYIATKLPHYLIKSKAGLEKCFQEDAEEIAAEFEKAYPNNRLVDVLSLDYILRYVSKDFIAKKSVHKEAPVYSYMFNYEFPYEGGKLAWHCSEIPFVFHNIDRIPICNVPGETDRLQERICGAWINFARYGNPSVPSLPQWSVCEPGKEAIMIFDNICEVKDNYDHRLMELLVKHAPAFTVPLDEDAENVFMH